MAQGKPQQLVDLYPRFEASAAHLHHPVARHLVAPATVDVSGTPERPYQVASQARLLAHLTQRAVFGRFVGLDLAFRQSPVVVLGTMDDRDLGLTRPRIPGDDPARSSDHAYIRNIKDLCCHRCSSVCCTGWA